MDYFGSRTPMSLDRLKRTVVSSACGLASRSVFILGCGLVWLIARVAALGAAGTIEFASFGELDAVEWEPSLGIEVRRSDDTDAMASVSFATEDGSAKSGIDYMSKEGVLTFAPGETSKFIAVTLLDNGRIDGDRTFRVRLFAPGGAILGSAVTFTIRIHDNETPVMADPEFRPQLDGYVSQALVQPDGRIVIAGDFRNVSCEPRSGLARLHADGSIDHSFRPPEALGFVGLPMAMHPDGRLYVSTRQRGLVRLHPDGALDASFDPHQEGSYEGVSLSPDGRRLLLWGLGEGNVLLASGAVDHALREEIGRSVFDPALGGWSEGIPVMMFQPDGKILVAAVYSGQQTRIVRLHPDGLRDPTFQASVTSVTHWDPEISMLYPMADGSVYIAGRFDTVNGIRREIPLARLLPDGTLDTSYDPRLPFGVVRAYPGIMEPDGRLLVSFYQGFPSTPVLRFNRDGTLDATFRTSPGHHPLALQPDGMVLMGSAPSFRRIYGETRHRKGFLIEMGSDLTHPLAFVPANGAEARLWIHRLGESTGPASVLVRTRDGSARSGVDYGAVDERLTFEPLETEKSIAIRLLGDRPSDFYVEISNSSFEAPADWSVEQRIVIGRTAGVVTIAKVRCDPARPVMTVSMDSSGPVIWEASTDLQTWQAVHLSTDLHSAPEFQEAKAANYPQRFYRARKATP